MDDRIIEYFIRIWIPEFAADQITKVDIKDEDDQEWLEATMIEAVDKFTVLQEKSMTSSQTREYTITLMVGAALYGAIRLIFWVINAGLTYWF